MTHVATVITHPGESVLSTIFAQIAALLLPTAGVLRGLSAIVRCAKAQGHPLQVAARSGALCMVVRTKSWTPLEDFEYRDVLLRNSLKRPTKNRATWKDIWDIYFDWFFHPLFRILNSKVDEQ